MICDLRTKARWVWQWGGHWCAHWEQIWWRETSVWSAEVWIDNEEVENVTERGKNLNGCNGNNMGSREDFIVKDGRDSSMLLGWGERVLGEVRDQERMMATDGTGPRRGRGTVGGSQRSRDSSPSETTLWSGQLGQAGSLQGHMVPFWELEKAVPTQWMKRERLGKCFRKSRPDRISTPRHPLSHMPSCVTHTTQPHSGPTGRTLRDQRSAICMVGYGGPMFREESGNYSSTTTLWGTALVPQGRKTSPWQHKWNPNVIVSKMFRAALFILTKKKKRTHPKYAVRGKTKQDAGQPSIMAICSLYFFTVWKWLGSKANAKK